MDNTVRSAEDRQKLRKMRQRRAQMRRKKQIRRLIAVIIAVAAVAVILIVAAVMGIFEKRSDTNTLTVQKSGRVIYEEIQKSTDDASDIREFAEKQITSFDDKNGRNAVRLERFSTRGGHIYLRTSYKDTSTYTDFTGYEMFNGSTDAAEKAGYSPDTTTTTANEASADAFAKQNVLIIREDGIRVKIPGTVTGTSLASNVKYRSGSDMVTIDRLSDDSPAQLTYIFYK